MVAMLIGCYKSGLITITRWCTVVRKGTCVSYRLVIVLCCIYREDSPSCLSIQAPRPEAPRGEHSVVTPDTNFHSHAGQTGRLRAASDLDWRAGHSAICLLQDSTVHRPASPMLMPTTHPSGTHRPPQPSRRLNHLNHLTYLNHRVTNYQDFDAIHLQSDYSG